jgi:hypothetical protein
MEGKQKPLLCFAGISIIPCVVGVSVGASGLHHHHLHREVSFLV